MHGEEDEPDVVAVVVEAEGKRCHRLELPGIHRAERAGVAQQEDSREPSQGARRANRGMGQHEERREQCQ